VQQSTRLQREEVVPLSIPLSHCDESAFVQPVLAAPACAVFTCGDGPSETSTESTSSSWTRSASPHEVSDAWEREPSCDEACCASQGSVCAQAAREPRCAPLRPEVLKGYFPLVRKLVRQLSRHLPPNVQRDDLLGAGLLGLIDSLRRNGGSGGETFAGYARVRIRGAIVDELRAQDWLSRRAREAVEAGATGKVCATMFVSLSEVTPAEESVHMSGGDDPSEVMIARSRRRALVGAIANLPERERRVVRMYYFEGAKLKEIGAKLGVGEPRVSQLHARALGRLRGMLSHA
jgi:RNA polymerase sigma factor FliA